MKLIPQTWATTQRRVGTGQKRVALELTLTTGEYQQSHFTTCSKRTNPVLKKG
ncbi:hypothetical protein M404DRAFT_188320 [Pisolithus tinctorius Marx 270]|uniref:Uncharacterized protein n=1 Tax=Pisolithus tinctorius Marx 270 TaxID=870435 RepID=A0A0C3KZ87_PISTI|nr:hypothetical protein M404DRAFT_188320 [Pisolithus tinctorius Marx 270]